MATSVKLLSICLEKPLMDSHADVTKWLKNKTALSEKLIKRWLNSHKATKTTTFGTFYAKVNMLLLDSKQKLTFKPTKHVSIAESFVHRLSAISGDRYFYLIDLDIAENEGWGTIDKNMSYSDVIDVFTVKATAPQVQQQSVDVEQSSQDTFNPKSNEHVLICQGRYLTGTLNVFETSTEDPVLNWVGKNLDMVMETSRMMKDVGCAVGIQMLSLHGPSTDDGTYTLVLCNLSEMLALTQRFELMTIVLDTEHDRGHYCLIYKSDNRTGTAKVRSWVTNALREVTQSPMPKVARFPMLFRVEWKPDVEETADTVSAEPVLTPVVDERPDISEVVSLSFNCNDLLRAVWESVHVNESGAFKAGIERLRCPALIRYVNELMLKTSVADLVLSRLSGTGLEQISTLLQRRFIPAEYFQWVRENYSNVKT